MARPVFTSSVWWRCPPDISPVTFDHYDLFELPPWPLLSTAAELFVVNLVAQHDPQADTQFVRRRNPCLAHPFLDQLATIEAFQLRIFSYRMDRRFGPQIA